MELKLTQDILDNVDTDFILVNGYHKTIISNGGFQLVFDEYDRDEWDSEDSMVYEVGDTLTPLHSKLLNISLIEKDRRARNE